MKRTAVVAAVSLALFSVAGLAQANTIGSQTDPSTQVEFISDSAPLFGIQGNIFTLPPLTGTLKSFDFYLSMSGFRIGAGYTGAPPSVQVVFGGSDCPVGQDLYSAAALGIPTNNADVSGNLINPPALVQRALIQGTPLVYTGQSDCVVQFLENGVDSANLMETAVATGTTDQIYFVGYNTYGTPPTVTHVSLVSDNASSTLARAGDHVRLDFDVDRPVQTPQVTIEGRTVDAATTTGNSFEASTTLIADDDAGAVPFSILVTNLLGDDGPLTSTTTDNSAVAFDDTAPVLTITSGPGEGATATSSTVAFTFTSDDPSSATLCSFDGVATSTCAGSSSATLADGPHTFSLMSTDAAGNIASTSRSFTVAAAPPVGSLAVIVTTTGGNGTFSLSGPAPLGSFSIATTLGLGEQDFSGIPAGTYSITPQVPSGWTLGDNTCAGIIIAANASVTCTINFSKGAVGKKSLIVGLVYNDKNGNGRPDKNEISLLSSTGIKVYLDTNNNGVYNAGEPSTLTTLFGLYFFKNLAPGSYTVRIVPPAGKTVTAPAAGSTAVTLRAGHLTFGGLFGYK